MHTSGSARRIGGIFLTAGIAWMIWRQRHFAGWIDDDAFISLRYARNWAEGNGLVFNVGERVEGFTNFLWTALLALAHLAGLDLPVTAQILGSVFALLTVLLLATAAASALPEATAPSNAILGLSLALIAPIGLAGNESWAAWSVGGLENVCSGFLVLAAFILYFRSHDSATNAARCRLWCSVVLCLAVLNHPTNAIFAAVIGVHLLWAARQHQQSPRSWLPFFVVIAVVLAGFLAARYAYYGELLPNTWYAKGGMSVAVWQRGLRYLLRILMAQPLSYIMAIGIAVGAVSHKLRNTPLTLLAIACLLYTLYIVAVGGEEFPAYRSTVVLLPLFSLMLPAVTLALWRRMGRPGSIVIVATLFLLLSFTLPMALNERLRRLDTAVAEGRTALSRTAALMLKAQLPSNTLFAHSGAGLIAYYTNFRWIDTLGLCDAHIARTQVATLGEGAAGHEKGDGQYVWSRQPDYVMFPGYPISNRLPGTKSDKELWAIAEFHQRYRPLRVSFSYQAPKDAQPQQHSLFLYQRIP
jgi:arabinofuranosyltransferase